MRVLGPVELALIAIVNHIRQHFFSCSAITSQYLIPYDFMSSELVSVFRTRRSLASIARVLSRACNAGLDTLAGSRRVSPRAASGSRTHSTHKIIWNEVLVYR